MRKVVFGLGFIVALALGGFGQALGQGEEAYVREAREVIMKFGGELKSHLQKQMQAGGPAAAITVCSEVAPAVSSKLSRQKGWMVKRVSLKARNPLDIPDAWERYVLQEFDKRAAAGVAPKELERSETVKENGQPFFRYMKAIPAGDVCMMCHGPKEKLPADVHKLLLENYPHDTATGYSAGMIRGAFSIKRPVSK
jgi:hypothetical protein